MQVVRKAEEAPCWASLWICFVYCLQHAPWRPRCKSMAKRIWHSCQVHPGDRPSCRSIIPHNADSKVAVSPIIPPDDSIINGSNPICCCSHCCFVSRCLHFKSAYRIPLTKGEELAICWVCCWNGLVMAQSNASRGNLLQDEMWISGRAVIKMAAGRCWGLLGSKPIGSNLGWVRVRWARRYTTLRKEVHMSCLCPWPIQIIIRWPWGSKFWWQKE